MRHFETGALFAEAAEEEGLWAEPALERVAAAWPDVAEGDSDELGDLDTSAAHDSGVSHARNHHRFPAPFLAP